MTVSITGKIAMQANTSILVFLFPYSQQAWGLLGKVGF